MKFPFPQGLHLISSKIRKIVIVIFCFKVEARKCS
ncbi:unnamed protein product [Schistosoma mattheei]|uniref:Uncharacterized protein n=1 Tax=Schistosoma mattheei TaxID=31246 RepID=A0A3P8GJ85_9TREM|nr:unnamed protein product [Schistosoma mattheei]